MPKLKVLACNPDGGAFLYILRGIGNAFKDQGHAFSMWNGQPHFLTTFKPDIYIGCSGWRQEFPEAIRRKFGTKVAIHVNPYGTKKVGSIDGGPRIDEATSAVQWTTNKKPDAVFCYADDQTISEYYNNWTDRHGIPVIAMPTAADYVSYGQSSYKDKFACDIGWIGGKWPYKAKMMNKYLEPLKAKYKCRFYGWNNAWKTGAIKDESAPNLFRSAKICPSISESHTVVHPVDMPERVFKVPCAGGFTIHTKTRAIERMGLEDVIPVAENNKEWVDLIEYYLKNEEERVEKATHQKIAILKNHTYFSRVANFLSSLEFEKEAEEMHTRASRLK